METYRPRTIIARPLHLVDGWRVKIYVVTPRETFESEAILENAIARLSEWLTPPASEPWHSHKIGFLIFHEGADGLWSLVNRWVADDMLQSATYYTDYREPDTFIRNPAKAFMACVWELPIIAFERDLWVEEVLKKAPNPDFDAYFGKALIGNV
jgi:hypothetical protein